MTATPIAYDPEVIEGRLASLRRRLIGALTGLLLPVLLGGGLYLVLRLRDGVQATEGLMGVLLWFLAFSAAVSLIVGFVQLLWYLRMRRQRVAPGLALQLSAMGIEVEQARLGWDEVTALRTGWSRLGDGHTLVIERMSGGPIEIPLDSLTILPGSLDSAIRAHSGGRHWLDLSAYGA